VLDDPTRLRRSLKKETKAAAKRGAAWAQRTSEQQQSQAERQKRCETGSHAWSHPLSTARCSKWSAGSI
jgi:Surfeit locus protein 6